jgi:membrane-associated phospholipid phosphatase
VPPASGLFESVNRFARNTPWLHPTMAAYAVYGIAVFAGFIVVGWWLARSRDARTMAYALITPVAAVAAYGVQQVIVGLVGEARPYALLPDALVLVTKTTDPSFPSDHACVSAAVVAGLFFVDRGLGWVAAGAALLMAFARVYVGAHWPLDVVAGLAVGATVSLLAILLLRGLVERLVRWARGTPLRPLVAGAAG